MKACALALLAVSLFAATDDLQMALALKAQSDFDRVQMSARPKIPEAETCVQSQAAALAVGAPQELSLLQYRKGFCSLAGALTTHDRRQFLDAVAAFDKAVESWPLRMPKNSKMPPEPVSSALRVFAGIARLHLAGDATQIGAARHELARAMEGPVCNSNLMPVSYCQDVLTAGSLWLGWIALRDNQMDTAARYLDLSPLSGWSAWAKGRHEFASARYSAAAAEYATAVSEWKRIWQGDGPTFLQALGPKPQYPDALTDWGAAQLLAGDLNGAISALDASLQTNPSSAHALFLRARAKELAGRKDAALADYGLASRSAFAAARDLASGDAHLYRGIALYRRQDFSKAEEEFASALSFEMTDALRPDARAWRHLAAVAGGACGTARDSLSGALAGVSPYFPQDEARAAASACVTSAAR